MFRNSTVYRKYRYIKKRRGKKIFAMLVLSTIVVSLVLIMYFIERTVMPFVSQASEQKAKAVVAGLVDNAVIKEFSNGMSYDDLVTVVRDPDLNVESIETKIDSLNALSERLTNEVGKKLSAIDPKELAIPVGKAFGSTILAKVGPDVHFRMALKENITSTIKSEFQKIDESQTIHRIVLKTVVQVTISDTFDERTITITTSNPVAETVIVGDIPTFYLESDELPVEE